MIKNTLAIITARGGSKRIPRKNIKNFLGRPIIAYSIEAAIASGCFDEVMVSTDDEEIASIARNSKAVVPFLRTRKTSDDFASTADVISEVLMGYSRLGRTFSFVCCIYPAAPFITAEKIKAGYDLIIKTGADSVIPVVRFDYPVQRALEIKSGRLRMLWPENRDVRSQDLTPAYHDAGQFYWLNVERFLKGRVLFGDNAFPLEVPASEVQDIDTDEDWALAEMKFRMLNA
ncbi:MAG TPA: pseudaminic acid cytidylyltransferase [Candidatus Omnitrophica bacterium]|nr:pseudaminic acid cytidylyltransferase [Candidatus Omnitrophota bacterium]